MGERVGTWGGWQGQRAGGGGLQGRGGPCVVGRGGGRLGQRPEGVANPFPRPRQLVLGGRGILGLVLSAGAHAHPTLLVHGSRAVRRPCRVGFAPSTQPVGMAGESSGRGVVWCGVVLVCCGVLWNAVLCSAGVIVLGLYWGLLGSPSR